MTPDIPPEDHTRILALDEDIVTGETDIAYVTRGQTFDVKIASTSVWMRFGDDFRLVSWQSSNGWPDVTKS